MEPGDWLGTGGEGGTPTIISATDCGLLDGECDPAPPCCVEAPTPPFEGPVWVEIVDPGTPASCPNPTTEAFTAYAGMKQPEPHTCGQCSCSPAACVLPEGIHTNAAKCPGDGSIAIPFGPDPAAGWEGVCSDEGALPANLQCNGEPCIQSISIPPVPVAPCQPKAAPAAPPPDPEWSRMARGCTLDPLPEEEECGATQVCAPRPPGGYSLCLFANGEHPTCPDEYPVHEIFYTAVDDHRACTACQCSAQQGADCAAILSSYSDSECNALVVAVLVTDDEPTCVDVVSGTALGSAEAWMVTDITGSCAPSGGDPFGDVEPAHPLTLCCQGDLEAPG